MSDFFFQAEDGLRDSAAGGDSDAQSDHATAGTVYESGASHRHGAEQRDKFAGLVGRQGKRAGSNRKRAGDSSGPILQRHGRFPGGVPASAGPKSRSDNEIQSPEIPTSHSSRLPAATSRRVGGDSGRHARGPNRSRENGAAGHGEIGGRPRRYVVSADGRGQCSRAGCAKQVLGRG